MDPPTDSLSDQVSQPPPLADKIETAKITEEETTDEKKKTPIAESADSELPKSQNQNGSALIIENSLHNTGKKSTPSPEKNSSQQPSTSSSIPVTTTTAPDDAPTATGSTTTSYAVKWNNYLSILQNVFRQVANTHQFSDVVLACEDESIKCHRLLLSACSPYFEKLLREHDEPNLVIYIKDMKVWELKALLQFMYNGVVNVSEDQLGQFMKAAETFSINIKGLLNSQTENNISSPEAGEPSSSETTEIISSNHVGRESPLSPQINNVNKILPSSLRRGIQAQRNRPMLFRRQVAHQQQSNSQDHLKRKILPLQGQGPPRLVKMQRLIINTKSSTTNGTTNNNYNYNRANANNSKASSSSWDMCDENNVFSDDDDIVEFERAQLSLLLANNRENFADVSETIEEIEAGAVREAIGIDYGQAEQDEDAEQEQVSTVDVDDEKSVGGGEIEEEEEYEEDEQDEQRYDEDNGEEMDGVYYDRQNAQIIMPYDDDEEQWQSVEDDGRGGQSASGSEVDDGGNSLEMMEESEMIQLIQHEVLVPRNRSNARTYDPQLQAAALDALRNGISIRQSSEMFGIPRKTLAKWKNRGLHHLTPSELRNSGDDVQVIRKCGRPIGSSINSPESVDRAQRLVSATEMALSGITVRQAAAHFEIPRTTLCAYMKRQGLASLKQRPTSSTSTHPTSTSSNQQQFYSSTTTSRRVGNTIITVNNNKHPNEGEGDMHMDDNNGVIYGGMNNLGVIIDDNDDGGDGNGGSGEDDFPFLGLSDYYTS